MPSGGFVRFTNDCVGGSRLCGLFSAKWYCSHDHFSLRSGMRSVIVVVDVGYTVLSLDGVLCVGNVVFWVTIVGMNVAWGYGLWWGDVSSIFDLFLVEVCL